MIGPEKKFSNKPAKKPEKESKKEPAKKPAKKPEKELVKEPEKESKKELVKEPEKEPEKEPAKKPAKQPEKESKKELVKEPAKKPAKQPEKESKKELVKEPAKKPAKQPAKEPEEEFLKESVEDSVEPAKKKQWYIIKTKTNCEFRARDSIQNLVKNYQLTSYVGDVLIPEKDVVEVIKGKKVTRSKKFYPGYIFVQMYLTDRVWHLIRGVSNVVSFVGGEKRGWPPEVPAKQIEAIQNKVKGDLESPEVHLSFSVGESVVVIDGPFKGFSGVVKEVNQDRGRIKIEVSIFGGPTPVELDFAQVHSES